MNKNTGIIIGVIALLVIVGGVYASFKGKDEVMMEKQKMEQKVMQEKKMGDESMMENKNDNSMMKKEGESMMKDESMMKSGTYEVYSSSKVSMASADHHVVLFFDASWCPTCRALNSDIKANLSKIPSSLTILDVDYDNSTELKKKYGVTYQHTFVQVDKNGNLITKWSGGTTLASVVEKVK